jgi:hypothetical protein
MHPIETEMVPTIALRVRTNNAMVLVIALRVRTNNGMVLVIALRVRTNNAMVPIIGTMVRTIAAMVPSISPMVPIIAEMSLANAGHAPAQQGESPMQTSTKNSAPSEKETEKLLRQLRSISDALNKYAAANLTPDERRHLLKPRPGGDKISEIVTRVAADRKIEISGASANEINQNRTRVLRLEPLRAAAAALTKSLADTILQAESKAWWATTAVYTALQGAARSDGALKLELEPARTFFATGRRKAKAVPAAK